MLRLLGQTLAGLCLQQALSPTVNVQLCTAPGSLQYLLLGVPFISCVCACGGSVVHPWQYGTAYQAGGSHEPETDAHHCRHKSYVFMIREACIHALPCFYFRTMGSWCTSVSFIYMILWCHDFKRLEEKGSLPAEVHRWYRWDSNPKTQKAEIVQQFYFSTTNGWDLPIRRRNQYGYCCLESGFFVSFYTGVPWSPSWARSCHISDRDEHQQSADCSFCSYTGGGLHSCSFRGNENPEDMWPLKH